MHKELENITEPPDCTGNEPTQDIHIGGSGQDIIIQKDKNMPSVIKMVILCHVHHLSSEMTYLEILTKFLLQYRQLMSMITVQFEQIFSCGQNMTIQNG